MYQLKKNSDGSETIPKGFKFNRVGKQTFDPNASGALYVSYGKQDAARYVKSLGPTFLGKLLGTAGDTIQHISVKSDLKMASYEQTAFETASFLKNNKEAFSKFNDSLYSTIVTDDFDSRITKKDLDAAIKNPSGKEAQKLSYAVNSFLGDPNYVEVSSSLYEHFRSKGYDAIPDIHDRFSGTSGSATIVINPDKVEISSITSITKDVMKEGKLYLKNFEKLPVNDILKH